MSKLLPTCYGDDFTSSADVLEQLTLVGIRTALFIEPPTAQQLARFKNLQAAGVAGTSRSLAPDAMDLEVKPALKKLKAPPRVTFTTRFAPHSIRQQPSGVSDA